LATVIAERARQSGTDPSTLANEALRERFQPVPTLEEHEEWMQKLLSVSKDCGVSLTDEQLSREHMYD